MHIGVDDTHRLGGGRGMKSELSACHAKEIHSGRPLISMGFRWNWMEARGKSSQFLSSALHCNPCNRFVSRVDLHYHPTVISTTASFPLSLQTMVGIDAFLYQAESAVAFYPSWKLYTFTEAFHEVLLGSSVQLLVGLFVYARRYKVKSN